jgi:hypothetical protein
MTNDEDTRKLVADLLNMLDQVCDFHWQSYAKNRAKHGPNFNRALLTERLKVVRKDAKRLGFLEHFQKREDLGHNDEFRAAMRASREFEARRIAAIRAALNKED